MGLLGSVVSAGASLLGGAMSNKSQGNANAANIQLAKENREWATDMSNTSVQRRVMDMKKAGINPLLSVSGASAGASTPQSSPAQVQSTFDPTTIGTLLTSVSNAKVAEAEKKKIESETLSQESNQRKQDISNLKLEIETGNLSTEEKRKAEMHLKKLEHEDAQIGNINSSTQFNESKHRAFNTDIANTPDGQKETHYANTYGSASKAIANLANKARQDVPRINQTRKENGQREFKDWGQFFNKLFKGQSNARR